MTSGLSLAISVKLMPSASEYWTGALAEPNPAPSCSRAASFHGVEPLPLPPHSFLGTPTGTTPTTAAVAARGAPLRGRPPSPPPPHSSLGPPTAPPPSAVAPSSSPQARVATGVGCFLLLLWRYRGWMVDEGARFWFALNY